ncbi:hypothetical protein [Sphingomonas sanguinis]|uniref:hypothetical protein n=1 Tax=Sphingomonas sanguinis TaxID=33051 RepID=UPI000AD65E94|nr:hypothetical protein [Sphingomonas sanguinis]
MTTRQTPDAAREAQNYAFAIGMMDAKRGRVDGWANHSPSYRAGQVMARVHNEMGGVA